MTSQATFSVDLHLRDGQAVLDVHGEIDAFSLQAVQATALRAMADHGSLVLRLSDVTFIDSAGLRSLIVLKRSSDRDGTPLILEQPSRVVLRLLELTALQEHFTIAEDATVAD